MCVKTSMPKVHVIETYSLDEIEKVLRSMAVETIAIDGIDGSGKSTLARILSRRLGFSICSTDDYLKKQRGSYFENLDINAISAELDASQKCIIEGVCILKTLSTLGIAPDAIVYIKRMSHGVWSDEIELDSKIPIDEHIAIQKLEMQGFADIFGESGELGSAEEYIRYHAEFRPHKYATITYFRVCS